MLVDEALSQRARRPRVCGRGHDSEAVVSENETPSVGCRAYTSERLERDGHPS